MTNRFQWLADALEDADRSGVRRRLTVRTHQGAYVESGGRRAVNFGSNDYLGIALQRTVQSENCATGATSSPLVCGYTPLHARLCLELAALERTEAAVLFPTGFAACSAVMATLPLAGDLILSDALNHASLIDGCRLSKAERYIYPHRDAKAVAALLHSHRRRFHRAFLVTDSVFSMDGTIAPLERLVEIADEYDVVLIVDEAHATGVLGPHGGGLCELLGLVERVAIRIGTLSKAIGAHGGFVAAPRVVVDYLIQNARPLIYSTAAPPSTIAAALEGLRVVRDQPQRRQHVLRLASEFASTLRAEGLSVLGDETPIVPVIVGDPSTALAITSDLMREGFFVPAIRPPTVAAGTSRLRVSLSAAHSEEQVYQLADAFVRYARTGSRRK